MDIQNTVFAIEKTMQSHLHLFLQPVVPPNIGILEPRRAIELVSEHTEQNGHHGKNGDDK
jgi:hypothetical protein